MPRPRPSSLSRREREIMDVLHRLGRATAGEVMTALTGQPAYSTVRAQLRVLEEKGHIRHGEQNLRYVYSPALSRQVVQKSVLQHLVETFFEGSAEKVVATLIGQERLKVSDEELERIAEIIERARKERRRK
jgi:BlaI family transcriptional regulator, penicillinase repressor